MQKHLILGFLALLLLASHTVLADSTQQYNKIFLNPFYLPALANNQNVSFLVNVNPPDHVGSVVSAIINFQVYSTGQTVTYTLWVNNQSCSNPNYVVTTTVSSSGLRSINYDCSNVIKEAGIYNVTLRPSGANEGATSGWLDLVYMNNPLATVSLHGTEYQVGDIAKVWLQLLDSSLSPINTATCFVDIYYPDGVRLVEKQKMNFEEDGIYYFDILVPDEVGVYPAIATCAYQTGSKNFNSTAATVINGTVTANAFTSTFVLDGVTWDITSSDRMEIKFFFNNMTQPLGMTNFIPDIWAQWNGANQINVSLFNFTSGSFVQLPNPITNTAGSILEFSNSVATTNLTNTGFMNSTGGVILLLNGSAGGNNKKLRLDWVSADFVGLTNTTSQQVKGSSEIHASLVSETSVLAISTLCNEAPTETTSPACASVLPPTEFNFPEGEVQDNITVKSLVQTTTDTKWDYNFPEGIDCTALYYIKLQNGTSYIDVTNTTTESANLADESCHLDIPLTAAPDAVYHYIIKYDNFVNFENQWSLDLVNAINESYTPYCNAILAQANVTFTPPLTNATPGTSNTSVKYCERFLDDKYYFYIYNNASFSASIVGEQQSALVESRFYRNKFYQDIEFFNGINTRNNTIALQDTPTSVWTYPTRTLTNYNNSQIFSSILVLQQNQNTMNNTVNQILAFSSAINLTSQQTLALAQNLNLSSLQILQLTQILNQTTTQNNVYLQYINQTSTSNNLLLINLTSVVNSISSYLNGFVSSILLSINSTVTSINAKNFTPTIIVNLTENETTNVFPTFNVSFNGTVNTVVVVNLTENETTNVFPTFNLTTNVTNVTVIVNTTNTTVIVNTTQVNLNNITVVENLTQVNLQNITVVVNTTNTTVVVNTTNTTVVVNTTQVNLNNITVVENLTQINLQNITTILNVTNTTVVVNTTQVNLNNVTVVENITNTTVIVNTTVVNLQNITVVENLTQVNLDNITVVVNTTNTTVIVNTTQVNLQNITVVENITNTTVLINATNLTELTGLAQDINLTGYQNAATLEKINNTVLEINTTTNSIQTYLQGFITSSLNSIYANTNFTVTYLINILTPVLGDFQTFLMNINSTVTDINAKNFTVIENITNTTVIVNTTQVNLNNITVVENLTQVNLNNITVVVNTTNTTVLVNVTNTTVTPVINISNVTAIVNTTQLVNDLLNAQITETILTQQP